MGKPVSVVLLIMSVRLFRIVSVVLLLALMITVFCFSAQTADDSSSLSDGITIKIISVIFSDFGSFSKAEHEEIINNATFSVRKLAHFSLYFAMGILSFLSVVSYKKIRLSLRFLFSYLISVLYAVSDEIHQLFVPGRSCELRDVFIDSLGVLTALIILFIIYVSSKKIKSLID